MTPGDLVHFTDDAHTIGGSSPSERRGVYLIKFMDETNVTGQSVVFVNEPAIIIALIDSPQDDPTVCVMGSNHAIGWVSLHYLKIYEN